MARKLIILLGPTAVGKTDYSISLARKYDSPIISCDSRQIYKEMTIGTAVPSREQLCSVEHHFIQCRHVTDYYTAGIYETEALALIDSLFRQGHETLVMTGGSMFYIDAVCNSLGHIPTADLNVRSALREQFERQGSEWLKEELRRLDPAAYEVMELSNTQRVFRAVEICLTTGKAYSSFKREEQLDRGFEIEKIGLYRERDRLYERINLRVLKMVEDGLVDEVRSLERYRHLTALQTVGYKEVFEHLDNPEDVSMEQTVELIQKNTRHYAKRQMTWWRRDDSITWIDMDAKEADL